MKRIFLLFTIVTLSVLASCTKPLPCETNDTGTIKVASAQIDEFWVYVDQVYIGNAEAATFTEFTGIPSGAHSVLFINVNDDSEVYSADVVVTQCNTSDIVL